MARDTLTPVTCPAALAASLILVRYAQAPSSSPEPDDATALADPAGAAGDAPGLPSVSVVMPILNEERHLEEAVEAVLGQDYAGPARARSSPSARAATAPTRSPRG